MATNTGHVMTLANSIIGVSILAMPFCFKQCGILLATLMLLLSSIMTRLACHYLLKSAILTRRRNFEFLAFHTFGPTGKLAVELSIIGFMLGTCIAFFVVCGDLGPAIISPLLNVEEPTTIRPTVLIGLAVFVVLPLGLLRNVDSLAAVCVITIVFYMCLVLKVVGEATNHMISWDWLDKVNLWRPSGLLQCIPIFSMALSCQTQLFEVFESLPNASLDKMNSIVRSAVNICTGVYITMGVFGYIAFCTQQFSGNVMLSFSPTMASEVMKLGFVLSVAVSFPLIIFPCRASLHSLLFRRGHTPHHELLGISNHIPELRFQWITITIVVVSLITGLLIPNIELVLGLVGSTIGVMICIMFPALLFTCLTNKKNNERLLAQTLFAVGFLIMILGTYANLFATEQAISKKDTPAVVNMPNPKPAENDAVGLNLPLQPEKPDIKVKIKDETLKELKDVKELAALPELNKELKNESPAPVVDTRQEIKDNGPPPVVIKETKLEGRQEPPVPVAPVINVVTDNVLPPLKKEEPKQADVLEKKEESINKDAIKKEDDELKELQKEENKKQKEILAKLIKHEETQKKLIEKQKTIVKEMKKEREERLLNKDEPSVVNNKDDPNVVDDKVKSKKMENEVIVNKKHEQNDEMPKKNNQEFDKEKEEDKIQRIGEKLLDAKMGNLSENKEPKNKMTKKMEEGVPLPLAVKDIDNKVPENLVELKKDRISPVDTNNIVNEPKLLKRDILENEGDAKEERGKRDVEEVNKLDSIQKIEAAELVTVPDLNKQDNIHQIQNVGVDSLTNLQGEETRLVMKNEPRVEEKDSDKTFMKILDNERKKDESKKHCPDELAKAGQHKFTDELKTEKQKNDNIATKDLDNGKENIDQKHEIPAESVANNNNNRLPGPTTTESIIKAPLFLSNPDPIIINAADIKQNLEGNNDIVKDAAKPMKRDLKSVDPEKQEQTKDSEI